MVFNPHAPNPRRPRTVLRTGPRNLLEMTDADRTRIKRYAIRNIGVPPKQGPGFNQTSPIGRGEDDQIALVKRIREKQKSDDLIASNGRMVSAARKTSDHTDLAQLHAGAVRDKGDGALAELGDFACQLHKADPTACKRWKTAMKRELPGEMKRLEAAVQRIEAEEVKTENPERNEGKTITDVVAGMLDPDIAERGTLLPIGKDKDGNREFPVLPEAAVEALKAVMLPGHVINGGTVSEQDVTNMALTIAGGGLSSATPKGALRNGMTRLRGEPKFMRKVDMERQGKAAAHDVMSAKASKPQSMFREDVGEITFDYENGLEHIRSSRIEKDGMSESEAKNFIENRLPSVLAHGKLYGFNSPGFARRAIIKHDKATVVMSLKRHGNRETWVITGYEDFD